MKNILLVLINYITLIYAMKGSCYTCIWIRYRYPQTNFCDKYKDNCNKVVRNCTLYEMDKLTMIGEL